MLTVSIASLSVVAMASIRIAILYLSSAKPSDPLDILARRLY
jgi:hypothetical protein